MPESPDARSRRLKRNRQWQRDNRDRHNAYQRAWRKANPERVRAMAVRGYDAERRDAEIARARGRKALHRARLNAYKEARACADCGGRFPAVAMDFDHLDGSKKIALVTRMVARNFAWDNIEAEIAKCELVCANCHRIRTFARQQHRRPRIAS